MLIARFSHETNTFARPFAQREDFFDDIRGTGAEAFVEEVGLRNDLEACMSVIAAAFPCGPVEHSVYEYFVRQIVADVARVQPRAILLDLHGAMVTSEVKRRKQAS